LKKLFAVTLLTCIAAWGQTTTKPKHKPAVAAHIGWTKYELKDEITDKTTTVFSVSSLPPEKAMLTIICRPEKPLLTMSPHFQVGYTNDSDHTAKIPIQTDGTVSEITVVVVGDLDDSVWFGNEPAILESTKSIKIRLFEFGNTSHVMTFQLQGPAPKCPAAAS
jgi:hypothetical protein